MEYDNSIAQVLIDESINMLNCSDNSNIDDITNGRSGLRFSIPRSPIEIEITGKTHNFNYFGSQRSISDSRRPSTPHIPRPMVSPQAPIGIDEFIPSMLIRYQGQVIDIAQLFQTQLGVVFGVPGAFSPVCSEMHVQGFKDNLSEFHSRNIRLIACIAVNDPFVVKAWAQSMGLNDEIVFISDSTGALSRKLRLLQDFSSTGMGLRCCRCAMVIGPESKVRWIGFESNAFAPSVIKKIDEITRNFLDGIHNDNLRINDHRSKAISPPIEIATILKEGSDNNRDKDRNSDVNVVKGQDGVNDINSSQRELNRGRTSLVTPDGNDVNSFIVSLDHPTAYALKVPSVDVTNGALNNQYVPRVRLDSVPEVCVPRNVIAELEEELRGLPHDDASSVVYEINRSQCNFLCEPVDGSDADCTTTDDDENYEDEKLDDDGFDYFLCHYDICHACCNGRSLYGVGSESGDEALDIKFGYLTPNQCRFVRRKATQSINHHSLDRPSGNALWNFYIEPRFRSAGYILVDSAKFYIKEIHFHSPSVHLLQGSNEPRPVEMHIVHVHDSTGGEILKRVIVLALTFVWEPDYNFDGSSDLIRNIVKTVLGKTFKSDGRPNLVDFSDAPLDFQKFIAANTMAAFYRYTTDSVSYPPIVKLRDMTEIRPKDCSIDNSLELHQIHLSEELTIPVGTEPIVETTWIVARDGIPLSLELFQSLRLVLGYSSLQDPSTFCGSANRLTVENKMTHGQDSLKRMNHGCPITKFPFPSTFLLGQEFSLKRSSTAAGLGFNDSNCHERNTPLFSPTTQQPILNSRVTLIVSSMLH